MAGDGLQLIATASRLDLASGTTRVGTLPFPGQAVKNADSNAHRCLKILGC